MKEHYTLFHHVRICDTKKVPIWTCPLEPIICKYASATGKMKIIFRQQQKPKKNSDMNWSFEGFHCIPHALLLAELAVYSIDDNLILYRHSYLLNRKHCVRINIILTEFNKLISGVPQGFINCFFNNLYYFIKNSNVHNFANDNAITTLPGIWEQYCHWLV